MAKKPQLKEKSRYKLNPGDFKSDRTLREDRGWLKMDVRWVITERNTEFGKHCRRPDDPAAGRRIDARAAPPSERRGVGVCGARRRHQACRRRVVRHPRRRHRVRSAQCLPRARERLRHRAADHALGLQRRAEPGEGRLHHPGGRRRSRRRRKKQAKKK